jgi:hypothetical protein
MNPEPQVMRNRITSELTKLRAGSEAHATFFGNETSIFIGY